jgi:hypothetical protein
MTTRRERCRRLKRVNIDVTHYRNHPQAIEARIWHKTVTITRAGKGHLWLSPPWLLPPSIRNRRLLPPCAAYQRKYLRSRQMPLRNLPMITDKVRRR